MSFVIEECAVEQVFHYPPELLTLLTDAISNVVRSKTDVIKFFQGAGVPSQILTPWSDKVRQDRQSVYKSEIAREVLCKLNELGDTGIRPRREVVKRIVEWEDFSTAYPDKQLIAQGLVANVRKVVNTKDSFTRMNDERERERQARQAAHTQEQKQIQKLHEKRTAVKQKLYALFQESDAHKRGKALEGVLNELFEAHGILVREAFTLRGVRGEGIIEQIDGLVEFRGHLYFVEMKWYRDPIGRPELSPHLVSVYGRGDVRGLFISASGYTPAAIADTKNALTQKVCVLMDIEEIVALLEREGELQALLQRKVVAAEADRNPFLKVIS
jgi:restriction endonuclease Mrr